MRLTIETYARQHLEGITSLYNAETASEPYIAPLTPERFIQYVERKTYFDPAGLLVAIESGTVIGWVHACVAPGSEPRHDPGEPVARIRMLIYPASRLEVGRVLVSEATDWLRRSGQKVLLAMHSQAGYPFYRGLWLGSEPKCPATMPHLQLALEVGGYKTTLESAVMAAEIAAAPGAIPPPRGIELIEAPAEMAHEPMRESWDGFEPIRVRAYSGGQELGSLGWVLLPQLAERLGAPCMSIWSMGVKAEHRRRGIATAMLARAMSQARSQGARFALVSTQLWNAPAHATYAKLGFTPYCVTVGRTLDLWAGERDT